jgi:LytR cell envelope-related transcriptional attenuator/Protein of unknown function (DUF2510)
MSNEGDLAPPQWAPDPTGRHDYRYWDGSEWSEHAADGSVPPGPPPEAAAPPPTRAPAQSGPRTETAGRRRRGSKRGGYWLGVLTGAVMVAGAVAVAVFGFRVSVNSKGTNTRKVSSATSTTRAATTTTVNPGRPVQQVRVEILNGSAIPRAAGTKAFALGALGYQIAGIGNAPEHQGSVVQCKPGFELEAVTLAKNVAANTTVGPFPNPPPTGSAKADCVVLLGR